MQNVWGLVMVLAASGALVAGAFAQELPEAYKQYFPASGTPPKAHVAPLADGRGGYIVLNGKPFFRNLHHGWSPWQRMEMFKVYRYYLWTNQISLGSEARLMGNEIYKLGVEAAAGNALVNHRLNEATRLYNDKLLVSAYINSLQYEVPEELKGQTPQEQYRLLPDYLKRWTAGMAAIWRHHPAFLSYETFEEYWLPGYHKGDIQPPVEAFQKWCQGKFKDVAALNTAWGTTFADFQSVTAAEAQEVNTAKRLDWQDFLTDDNFRRIDLIYRDLKAAHPEALVAGAKGETGRAEWTYAPATDLFGWYCAVPFGYGISNSWPRAAADRCGKVFECIHVNYCSFSRTEPWQRGEVWQPGYGRQGYAHILTEVFEGMKDMWLEDYGDASFHYFHPTEIYRRAEDIRSWSGARLYIHPKGKEGPPVMVPPYACELTRVYALCYRMAPLFLPAHMVRPNVAMLVTGRSFAKGYSHNTSALVFRDYPEVLRRLHQDYDVVRPENIDELSQYRVLIVGGPARTASAELTGKIEAFVRAGGRVILLPEGLAEDERDLSPSEDFRRRLGALGGAVKVVRDDELPPFGPTPGAQGRSYRTDYSTITRGNYLQFWDGLLREAGAKQPAQTFVGGKVAGTEDLTLGVLKGNGYWLVGVANFAYEPVKVDLRLSCLEPDANYTVADITGERPIVRENPESGYVLADDPDWRKTRVLAVGLRGTDLAARGLAGLEIPASGARVLLVMPVPAAEPVWTLCPDYELRTVATAHGPARVVIPDNAAPELRDVVRQLGLPVVAASEIKTRPTSFDAVVTVRGAERYGLASLTHKVHTFKNEPVDTDTNLIVIGSAAVNKLTAHLEKPDTFVYDKVLFKVDSDLPAAYGVIQVVESINDPSFDPTDQTRDAIVVSGNNDQATLAAVRRLAAVLTAPAGN